MLLADAASSIPDFDDERAFDTFAAKMGTGHEGRWLHPAHGVDVDASALHSSQFSRAGELGETYFILGTAC